MNVLEKMESSVYQLAESLSQANDHTHIELEQALINIRQASFWLKELLNKLEKNPHPHCGNLDGGL